MDLDPLVFAHRAQSIAEAQLIRSLLLSEGIFAMVREENTPLPGIDLSPLKPEGQVGTEILVRPQDVDRARELIAEKKGSHDSESDTESPATSD